MSRDPRDDSSRDAVEHSPAPGRSNVEPAIADLADRRERVASDRWLQDRIELPRTPDRRPVILDRSRFMLRNSESELLETVGAFRAIAVRDLKGAADGDIRSLRGQGLLFTRGLIINRRSERVAVLTRTGRKLLERSRDQPIHVGLVKPRELEHDAQLYRMFRAERERLEAEGATITRVVLDYQISGDYHRYLHEQQLAGVEAVQAKRDFAEAHDLPFAGEHICLPDVRVEYETADGLIEYRDLEFATEHYSRSQLAARLSAGFRVCRAVGTGARRGGTPSDPHRLEWIK
jgi:hypothetical protein